MNGSSAAATSARTRWKRSSTKKEKTTRERRPASSPWPEQPTILPTSYTTSRDLTRAVARKAPVGWLLGRAPGIQREIGRIGVKRPRRQNARDSPAAAQLRRCPIGDPPHSPRPNARDLRTAKFSGAYRDRTGDL